MRKINLCRVVYEFSPIVGGSVTHTIELATHMTPYCERQFFIVPKIKEDTSALDASFPFEVFRVKYCEFKFLQYIKTKWLKGLPMAPLINLSFSLAVIKKCLWLNKEYGIDIIHAHGINPGATIAGKIIRKPTVWMMHGTNEAYSKIAGYYETAITWIFKPDHLLVLDDGSPAPAKFHKLMRKDKVTTVYHAIDNHIYCPKNRNNELAGDIGVKNSFVLMGIQSLIPVKGVDYSIKAFAELLKLGVDNVKLVLIGAGSLRNQLEQVTADYGVRENVIFLGEIANFEIPEYLSLADITIATSTYSNMNRSVQEAMSCGKPVITFSSGGTSKIVIDGETGLLAKSGDIEDLANKLLILNKDSVLREKLGKNARKFIIENRSWESRIDIELGVYNNRLIRKF